ncbi:MAG: hypothetical protein J7K17_02330, partial [Candidatus Omnitrophica bacterium]|nr:hypothetical protein [Candidatus Omnitrophota bacterium]
MANSKDKIWVKTVSLLIVGIFLFSEFTWTKNLDFASLVLSNLVFYRKERKERIDNSSFLKDYIKRVLQENTLKSKKGHFFDNIKFLFIPEVAAADFSTIQELNALNVTNPYSFVPFLNYSQKSLEESHPLDLDSPSVSSLPSPVYFYKPTTSSTSTRIASAKKSWWENIFEGVSKTGKNLCKACAGVVNRVVNFLNSCWKTVAKILGIDITDLEKEDDGSITASEFSKKLEEAGYKGYKPGDGASAKDINIGDVVYLDLGKTNKEGNPIYHAVVVTGVDEENNTITYKEGGKEYTVPFSKVEYVYSQNSLDKGWISVSSLEMPSELYLGGKVYTPPPARVKAPKPGGGRKGRKDSEDDFDDEDDFDNLGLGSLDPDLEINENNNIEPSSYSQQPNSTKVEEVSYSAQEDNIVPINNDNIVPINNREEGKTVLGEERISVSNLETGASALEADTSLAKDVSAVTLNITLNNGDTISLSLSQENTLQEGKPLFAAKSESGEYKIAHTIGELESETDLEEVFMLSSDKESIQLPQSYIDDVVKNDEKIIVTQGKGEDIFVGQMMEGEEKSIQKDDKVIVIGKEANLVLSGETFQKILGAGKKEKESAILEITLDKEERTISAKTTSDLKGGKDKIFVFINNGEDILPSNSGKKNIIDDLFRVGSEGLRESLLKTGPPSKRAEAQKLNSEGSILESFQEEKIILFSLQPSLEKEEKVEILIKGEEEPLSLSFSKEDSTLHINIINSGKRDFVEKDSLNKENTQDIVIEKDKDDDTVSRNDTVIEIVDLALALFDNLNNIEKNKTTSTVDSQDKEIVEAETDNQEIKEAQAKTSQEIVITLIKEDGKTKAIVEN